MSRKDYQSGMFCIDINCAHHKALEGLKDNAYMDRKKELCGGCYAWKFFVWLQDHKYRMVQTLPEMPNRELVARIKGIDPVRVEDLTDDEILCL
ncbi:MAG: hypothetical protein CVV44_05150 [Spirochaetae bacterium HGW-Spirochaetae-1]|jgi:hypothetical protein|nr:MAG: hypothetical protein CVV44_05150 [Spirochaetae bacterium HGW-Spirochaetae-1]